MHFALNFIAERALEFLQGPILESTSFYLKQGPRRSEILRVPHGVVMAVSFYNIPRFRIPI